ncbi:unnamed protein product [Malus baccata var. baccata]
MLVKNSNLTRSSAVTIYKYNSCTIINLNKATETTYKKMSYQCSTSNDFQFFVSTVDPYVDRVAEAPRTARRAPVTHYVARDQMEDVDEEAVEFIKFEHKKFLVNQQSMRND